LNQVIVRLDKARDDLLTLLERSSELQRDSYDPKRKYQDLVEEAAEIHRELQQTRSLIEELAVGVAL
jgi:hypothetical protein